LTGAVQDTAELDPKDWRRANPRFAADNVEQNKRLVTAVAEIAQARGCTSAQLALAWLLHQGEDIVPIPGTRRISRLDENAGAARIELTRAEIAKIDTVLAEFPIAGARYPAASMATVNR
jgi:aryl-alcohol dehydrogenase-like predicted oxidoreductase